MKDLSTEDIMNVSGGKPKFFNFLSSILVGSIVGFFIGGPPGALAGAITGAGGATIKEGGQGIAEIMHPELFPNQ
jgi:hypothetical protein